MIKQEEWTEIFKMSKTGLSISEISRKIGKSIATVYRLLALGGPKVPQRKDVIIPRKISNFKNYLDKRIKNGTVNVRKLFFELKDLGYKGSYASINRYLKSQDGDFKSAKRSIRFETQPGEQAQVDWGSFGKIEINEKIWRLCCFIYVLGYSRAMYLEFTVKQDLQTFEQCHMHAFEKLGIPKTIVYDNIKTVVLRRERLPEGKLKIHYNPAFSDFSEYYGFEIKLCAPYWPQAKGKVEAGVKYVRNNFMKDIRSKAGFPSLEELNKKADFWLISIAHQRIHGTTGEKPIDRWLKEKSYLKFPKDFPPYNTSPLMIRHSTKDGLIQYKSNFYSIPTKFSWRKLFIKETNKNGLRFIEIYHEDEVIAHHQLSMKKGDWIIDDEHLATKYISKKNHLNKKKINRQIKNFMINERTLDYYDRLILGGENGKIKD